jgi:hypothetical protein
LGVWLGGTQARLLCKEWMSSACCWVLRRHLVVGGWVSLVGHSRPGPSNALLRFLGVGVVVVVVGSGCGGVLSVA